jgi:hypothetical protein
MPVLPPLARLPNPLLLLPLCMLVRLLCEVAEPAGELCIPDSSDEELELAAFAGSTDISL